MSYAGKLWTLDEEWFRSRDGGIRATTLEAKAKGRMSDDVCSRALRVPGNGEQLEREQPDRVTGYSYYIRKKQKRL